MLGRRCSAGGQQRTIYFTIYGAQTHGHQSQAPPRLGVRLCPAVPRLMTSEFPIRSATGHQEREEEVEEEEEGFGVGEAVATEESAA